MALYMEKSRFKGGITKGIRYLNSVCTQQYTRRNKLA